MPISIVVPVYNVEKHIDECVQSLLLQTYRNIEIILVDDGSTDSSLAKCLAYAKEDSRIKVITQDNQGVSSARNAGIREASSEWLMFVDSDDYVEVTMCERMMELMQQQPADLIMCKYARFSETKQPWTIEAPLPAPIEFVQDLAGENFAYLYENTQFNAPVCKLYRKSIVATMFDETLSLGEDLLFNLHYLLNCQRVAYLDEVLYYYRVGQSTTLSSKYIENRADITYHIYQESSRLFQQLFGSRFDNELLQVNFMKELCISIRKLLIQKHYSFQQQVAILNAMHAKYDVPRLSSTSLWQHTEKTYRLFFYLFEKKWYRVLKGLTLIQNKLK